MPTYEYECADCHVRFERRQRITDEPITTCPDCGGSTHRVLYPVGIIFKGSGFYCTDNRRNGDSAKSGSSPKADESKPTESSKDEVKTDSSATMPESKPSDKVKAASTTGNGDK